MVSFKNKFLKNFLIYTSSMILLTCGGSDGGSSPTEPQEPTYIVNLVSLGGAAQKGPFNNGTIINIAELNNSLTPTGKNFTSQIVDNSGTFSVSNVQMEFSYAQINASGFYFDEVGNKVSSAQLVLSGLSNLAGKTNMNVNVMSNLEMNRIKYLVSGDNPLTFAQAKIQAQEEVLAIFGFTRSGVAESELLDITQSGVGNAKLLAISAILQADRTVGQLSELLANISTDITTDGILNDAGIIESLRQSAYRLDLDEIRSNLESRYASLGLSVSIPDFETEVNNFYKPPVANDMNVSTDEDTDINITLDASDPEGESLTFSTVEVNNATVTINGNTATYSPNAQFNGTDTFTYLASDGTFNSNTATVTITVGAIDDEPNTQDINTSTDEDVSVVMTLTADEYDGDSYSFAIRSNPSNGSIALNGTQATYTPNQDFNGTDSFTFEAVDDTGRSINIATATITVNPINDAPIANNVNTQIDENLFNRNNIDVNVTYDGDNDILTNNNIKGSNVVLNNTSSIDITLDATDVDGDNLTYSVIATNNGTVTISGSIATYEPIQDWNGTDTFTYKANDGIVDSNTATVTIIVNSVNDAPTSEDEGITTNEDTAVRTGFSSSDVDGDDLTYVVVAQPSNGTVTIDNSNSEPGLYTPNANFNGTDTFTYKANDGELDSNIATATVTVVAVNDAPTINDITISGNEDNVLEGTLVGTDIDGDDLTFVIESQPSNGTATITSDGKTVQYDPDNNFNGSDTFTFKANDGTVDSNTATATITVNAVNDAPTTNDINVTIDENRIARIVGINLDGADVDGDDLTYSIVSNASNGTTSISDATLTYTANQDWNGTETITYKANDGSLDSNTGTITITVNAVNDAPVVTGSGDSSSGGSLQFDGSSNHKVEFDVDWTSFSGYTTNTASEGDGIEDFTISMWVKLDEVDTPYYFLDNQSGNTDLLAFNINTANQLQLYYQGNGGYRTLFTGSNPLTSANEWYHLVITRNHHPEDDGLTQGGPAGTSGNVACGSDTGNGVRLYINGQFHCSRYDGGTRYNWDQGLQLGLGNANDQDFDGNMDGFAIWDDDLTANEVSRIYDLGRGADLTSNSGNYTSSGDLEIFYNFNEGSGTTLDDKTGNSSQDGTVSGASFIALGATINATTNEDTAKAITLSATDVDGDNLTYSIVAAPDSGSVSLSGSTATYTPNANYNGTDSFTYKANDGTVDSGVGTVNITITAVNDVPVSSVVSVSTNEDTAKAITLSATDVEGSSLTYSIVSNPSNGSLGSVSGASVTYTPNANYNGTDTFTYKANDGTADSNTSTVTVTIAAVNDTPTINESSPVTLNEDSDVEVTLSGTDVDGDTITFSIVTNPSNGSVALSGTNNKVATYTPTANYNGSDSFIYKANDGTVDSDNATVFFTITAVNDAPTAADVTLNLPYESDHSYSVDMTTGASDVEGSNLTYQMLSTDNLTGSYSHDGSSGTGTYTSSANFTGSAGYITYRASDGTDWSHPNTSGGKININITNDAPVASAVSVSTNEDTAKAITLSATDGDGHSLTYSIVSNPSNGSLGNISGTSVTYTPNANYNGTDTFTYKANDGPADSNTATVTVTVVAVEDLPVSSAVNTSTNEDTAKAITLSATDNDGDSLTYSIVSNPSNGSLGNVSGSGVTYTPSANWNGTDTFTYKANDGKADSNTSTVTVTVAAVNDIPTAADYTVNKPYESDRSYEIDMTLGASDVEGSNLTYQMLSTGNLTGGGYAHNGSSGTGTFNANANFTGSAGYITYRASDGTDWSHPNTSGGKIFINIIDTPGTKSLSFDGSGDNITISEDASLVSSAFTYQAWIKPAQANNTGEHLRVVSRGVEGGGQNRLIISHDPNETLQFGLFSNQANGGRSETVNTTATLSTTNWTHVVVTFGTNGVGKIYLNGSVDSTFDLTEDDASHVNSGGLRIGSAGGNSDFNGKIDEVAFWDESLTDAEVTALYNSGNGLDADSDSGNYSSSSGLNGYWKMSEQTGNTVADSSSESNTGTINNASWSHE